MATARGLAVRTQEDGETRATGEWQRVRHRTCPALVRPVEAPAGVPVGARQSGRRRSLRVGHRAIVCFHVEGRGHLVWCLSLDISRAGLYLRTLTAPPVGSLLRIMLKAPVSGREVRLLGRVIRHALRDGLPGMGIAVIGGETGDLAAFDAAGATT